TLNYLSTRFFSGTTLLSPGSGATALGSVKTSDQRTLNSSHAVFLRHHSLADSEQVILSAGDNHLAGNRRSGHQDFSNRITSYQLIGVAGLYYKDISVFAR